ncbi:beta-1,4-galactosyltransferase 7 [Venturia canescens]|uniref:beta-1,4-galactosyltransferase 7 n=1 Tax=Venturia canescens TaxID=32260 RepID=UPI001C9D5F3C|nr:beta-1,4-galactosyltransferase 7 [Venturia canescens]
MEANWKNLRAKHLIICILVTFVVSFLLSVIPFGIDECKCKEDDPAEKYENRKVSSQLMKKLKSSEHRLALLVPFRDRFEELLSFAPHMKLFLDKQNINYHIFILNQVDRFRFNRASLINVGFLQVKNNFDYIAMHDVDLLPINDELSYKFPADGPFHVSSPELHPRYHYSTFIGGILLIRREHFELVNGMSNKYWGWGLEDDEFYVRLKEAALGVKRPQNISTGTHNTFKHIHDKNHRKRDMAKCFNQREITRKRDRQTGLNNVSYELTQTINATISDATLTILNISLNCDKTITPWCECNKVDDAPVKEKTMKKSSANGKAAGAL